MYLFPLTLVFSSGLLVSAGSQNRGQNCSVLNNRLDVGTWQFYSNCNAENYCSAQGICEPKGCRKDQYPFGYNKGSELPPMCPSGQFCPDEGDKCQPLLSVGSPCQLNRDDQCAPPPNPGPLSDNSRFGINVNGAVCLNNVCMWANATLGQNCTVENTAYIVYAGTNEMIDIVSRGNCQTGMYCDAQQLICMQGKTLGVSCTADKECASYNCDGTGACIRPNDVPHKFALWVYVVVGVCIFGVLFFTLIALSWFHRRQRRAEREKRLQYWREQQSFRQSVALVQETARNSIISAPGTTLRDTMFSSGSEDRPLLQQQQHQVNKASGLRHSSYIDDNSNIE